MFLIESFRDYRSTEPVWFRFFRGFSAVALTGILLYYSITKFDKLITQSNDDPNVTDTFETNGKKNYLFHKNLKLTFNISNFFKKNLNNDL